MLNLCFIHFRIAFRNIVKHSRRSMLTIFAVAFGIFCLIVFQALMTGLHEKMMESSLGLDLGAIQIHSTGYETNMPLLQTVPSPASVTEVLTDNGLLTRAAPRVKSPALILAGKRSSSVILSGIDTEQEKNVTFIHEKVSAGKYRLGGRKILMGKVLADNLGLSRGDSVTVLIQSGAWKPVTARFTVGGLFRSGLANFDRSHVYLDIADAREILGVGDDAVTEIAIAMEPKKAESTARELEAALGSEDYQVRTFRDLAPDLIQLMELNTATFRLLIGIVFIIVAMGIANTMTTVIFERFRELGTLSAIGATPLKIVLLIVTESALLGVLATAVGSLAAVIASIWLGRHGIDLAHFTSSNQYFAAGTVLKARLGFSDVVTANTITLMTAILAGLFPAIRVARMKPVDALRYT